MMNATAATVLAMLVTQLAAFACLLLVTSGIHKLLQWRRMQGVVRDFGGVPLNMASLGTAAIILAEVVAGTLLLVPGHRTAGAMAAAGIWLGYFLLISRAVMRGRRDQDCGCGFGSTPHPLGRFQVLRNAVLAAIGILIATGSALQGSAPLEASQALGALALLILYAGLDQTLSLVPLRRGLTS